MRIVTGRLGRVLRRLGRTPLFTAVAVCTLGVGIGANTAIFSLIRGVLLKPLPFERPEELVGVWYRAPGLKIDRLNQAPSYYLTYHEHSRTFADSGIWQPGAVSVTGAGDPERVDVLYVTDGVLSGVLRIVPALGRTFTAEDDAHGAPERVVLTYGYWQRTFGGDATALGRTLMVNGRPHEIIGVLPRDFRFLDTDPQLVLPYQLNRAELFVGNFSHRGIARLKPAVTIGEANADVTRMIPIVMEQFPLPPGLTREMIDQAQISPDLQPLANDVIGSVGRVLWILFGTVGLVLLIACANVANLFLVRAEGRQHELAIHAALGAGSRRIAWELLSESLVLGLLGGLVGLGLAWAGIQWLIALAPAGLPRVHDVAIDGQVLLFTLAVALVAGTLFGLLPVARLATPRLAATLSQGDRRGTASRQRHRVRHALVVVEVALAVVLLVASGLMIRTFQALSQVDPGFVAPEQVVTFRLSVPQAVAPEPERAIRTHEAIAQQLAQTPGVTSVGVTSAVPMESEYNDPIFIEDRPEPAGRIPELRRYKFVEAGYFRTLGHRVVAGRPLTWQDSYDRAAVVVVSENFARRIWSEPAAAVGRRIRNTPESPWRTIVGVVSDERDNGLHQAAPEIVYWPLLLEWTAGDPNTQRNVSFVLRTERAASPALLQEIQTAVWSVNGGLPLANMRTLAAVVAASMAQTSFALVMLAIAGAVALLLGVVGISGVIAYIASQRTKEIGIRIALGAMTRDVAALFVRQGLVLAVIGVAIGLAAAGALTRLMASLLYGVSALDPVTYVAVAAGLTLTALVASYVPAVRAARVDPAEALRREG